jgi:UDP-N-acetylglucosamine:LPS N-acetylglucosamine transferase
MRIWIINHYALTPKDAGGNRHFQFARQLIQRGHEVIIIASNYNHFSQRYIDSSIKIGEIDITYDVPFMWIPTPSYSGNTIARFWNMFVFSLQLHRKKFIKKLFKPDVIIGSTPHIFSAFSAYYLSRRYKVPFILEVRDIWPDSLVDLGRFTKNHPLIKGMKHIEKYLYKKADKIISLLPMVEKYLSSFDINVNKVINIPNAIDTHHIPENILLKNTDTVNKKFTVMYAGAHGLANDLETILAAANILQKKELKNNIQIYLVGAGPDKNRLQSIAEKEKLHMVKFIDAVPKREIYHVLEQADAYLMLLKYSPIFRWGISPNKLFDYLMMAKPIIFGVESPFNPIKEYNAGISIPSSHPESLASAIYDLSVLPKKELYEMGQRGREFVLKNHNVLHLTNLLEDCIKQAVNMTH